MAVTVREAVLKLLESKLAGNRRPVYIKNLSYFLDRFAVGRETTPLSTIAAADIEAWLSQFPSPYYRQTWLNRLSTLFAFGVRRDFCQFNPCDKIERVKVDKAVPKILSPEQVETLLRVTPGISKAYMILGMFAGIRPEELMRLDWGDIDLETRTVKVDGKTRQRRIVPLEARCVTLLAGLPLQRGPVSPHNTTVRRAKRAACAALGLPAWPKDFLRHTAASYLLALHKDAGKVATMLGNSSAILLTHYHEPVKNGDCAEFWKSVS